MILADPLSCSFLRTASRFDVFRDMLSDLGFTIQPNMKVLDFASAACGQHAHERRICVVARRWPAMFRPIAAPSSQGRLANAETDVLAYMTCRRSNEAPLPGRRI